VSKQESWFSPCETTWSKDRSTPRVLSKRPTHQQIRRNLKPLHSRQLPKLMMLPIATPTTTTIQILQPMSRSQMTGWLSIYRLNDCVISSVSDTCLPLSISLIPNLEAVDTDGSGFTTIVEVNAFTRARPKLWRYRFLLKPCSLCFIHSTSNAAYLGGYLGGRLAGKSLLRTTASRSRVFSIRWSY
jgi:hypothetical protein